MSLTKFTGNTNVVSQLADVPVQTGDELKAKFDEAGTSIKNYLNNTLTTETEQLVATEKTALQNSISSLSTSTTSSINELRTAENAMISDGYSTTKSYKIGDLCIYNNVLYRCTTAIEEGEAWNGSHWEQTSIEANLNLIKGTILYKNINGEQASSGITLSESVSNYDFIEIYCGKSIAQGLNCAKIDLSIANTVSITNYVKLTSGEAQFITSELSVNGTSLTQISCQYLNISGERAQVGESTEMSVYEVIGYKY